jgi:hypothetical protein
LVNLEDLELKYKSWVQNDWKDGYNKPILNWKSKLTNNLRYIPEKLNGEKSAIDELKRKYDLK